MTEPTSPSTKKIRVLLVGPSLDILGGQAVQARRLLDGLLESTIVDASFLAVNPRGGAFLTALQKVKYVRTIANSFVYWLSLLRRIPSADVVHAFSASYSSYLLAPVPAMVVARLFGRATLLNYRSGEAEDHLARNRRTAAPFMRALADAIVTPSNYLVEVFARHDLRARSVANFVPLERLPYRRRTRIAPAFFSNRNLEPMYNVACTIRAFALVRERHPEATLTIAGDGSERPALVALVESLGARGVRFVGRVPNSEMGALYNAADVYLNSPDIDNMPGSIVEAFACGLPVVSTNAGGIPFVVDHGRNGLLVDRHDHQAMATAAMQMLQSPELALALADAGRRDCETRYVWSAVRGEWEAIYRTLAARRLPQWNERAQVLER